MTRTTIFVPVGIKEAIGIFLDQPAALRRLFNNGELEGLQTRCEAVAFGRKQSVFHFALLRIALAQAVVSALVQENHLDGHRRDDQTGFHKWVLDLSGLSLLETCGYELTMEVVPNQRAPE